MSQSRKEKYCIDKFYCQKVDKTSGFLATKMSALTYNV